MSLGQLFKTNLETLKKRAYKAYKQDAGDRQAIYNTLIKLAVETYKLTIQREITRLGCNRQATVSPFAFSDIEITLREHSEGIVNTYNRELESTIERIAYQGITKKELADSIDTWARQRQEYKLAQIVTMTQKLTRDIALLNFTSRNAIKNNKYIFVGAPPAEEVCASYFAAGIVDQQFVNTHPTPVHINCPHEWRVVSTDDSVDCNTMFTG